MQCDALTPTVHQPNHPPSFNQPRIVWWVMSPNVRQPVRGLRVSYFTAWDALPPPHPHSTISHTCAMHGQPMRVFNPFYEYAPAGMLGMVSYGQLVGTQFKLVNHKAGASNQGALPSYPFHPSIRPHHAAPTLSMCFWNKAYKIREASIRSAIGHVWFGFGLPHTRICGAQCDVDHQRPHTKDMHARTHATHAYAFTQFLPPLTHHRTSFYHSLTR
jgi:hypothetical protein